MHSPQRISLSTLGALLLASLPAAGDVRSAKRPLKLLDVFQLEYASDPRISPDGKRIVYVRNSMDIKTDKRRSKLWMIDVDGSNHRPLTGSLADESSPRFSPDGKRLVYFSGDGDATEVYCRWLDTGQTAALTRAANEPADVAFSPDGRTLAFTMFVPHKLKPFVELPDAPAGAKWAAPPRVIRNTRYRYDGKGYLKDGYRHVFVLSAEGGTPRQLTSGPFHHTGTLAFSGDGKAVLFSANRLPNWEHEPEFSELYAVSIADKRLKQLTRRKGMDHTPVVSPDGRRIVWLGFDDRRLSYQQERLYVMNVDGSDRRALTASFDRSVETPVWAADGSGLFVQYDERGSTHVAFVSLTGAVARLASGVGGTTIGRPYSSGSFSVARNGTFAFTLSTPDHPADVAAGRRGAKPRRLTRLNDDLLGDRQLATTEEFNFRSSHEGRRIQAWLVKPPGFDPQKKYPLILEIHGGPFANYGSRFSAEVQLYAAAGYVVLYVNPRGSTGYGAEFANLIHHAYPGRDYDDLMSGVDAAIRQGFIDAKNLFVTGGSGGGVLTSWIVGKTNRFRAAVAAKPVINWYSFVLTADAYPFFARYWFPGVPWEHAEHYLARSPLSQVGNVTTPTMLLTGESDHRTPISESEQFYQALKLRGVDTMLVRIPDASHAIVKRPSRLMVKVAYILKWFETHREK